MAREKANPFELIKKEFFQNRAALKMANMDAACDFLFTSVGKDEKDDVCFPSERF